MLGETVAEMIYTRSTGMECYSTHHWTYRRQRKTNNPNRKWKHCNRLVWTVFLSIYCWWWNINWNAVEYYFRFLSIFISTQSLFLQTDNLNFINIPMCLKFLYEKDSKWKRLRKWKINDPTQIYYNSSRTWC